jgi:hypothetical protein
MTLTTLLPLEPTAITLVIMMIMNMSTTGAAVGRADHQDGELRVILMDTHQTRISRTTDANLQFGGNPVVPTHLPVDAKTRDRSI